MHSLLMIRWESSYVSTRTIKGVSGNFCGLLRFAILVLASSCVLFCNGCGPPELKSRTILEGHQDQVISLGYAPDGMTLFSRSFDNTVRLWNSNLGWESRVVSRGSSLGPFAFSPDGLTVALNNANEGVVTINIESGKRQGVYSYPSDRTELRIGCYSLTYGYGVSYAPNGKTIVAGCSYGGDSGFVTFWDVASMLGENSEEFDSPVTSVAFAPDGKSIAFISGSNLRVLDVSTKKTRFTQAGQRFNYFVTVCFHPVSKEIVTACEDRSIRFWDVTSGHETMRIAPHWGDIRTFALSPDGSILVVADQKDSVFLYRIRTGKIIARIGEQSGRTNSIAFSPDGKTLAIGGADKRIRLYQIDVAL